MVKSLIYILFFLFSGSGVNASRIVIFRSIPEQIQGDCRLSQVDILFPLPENYPVIAVPAMPNDSLPMVFMISGDGGWTSFDNSIAKSLAAGGIPVAGLNSRKYFWNAKTPAESAKMVNEVILYYMNQWNRNKCILAGYSFGACIVPFIANLLPASLKEKIQGVYGLSPGEAADFEIHLSDYLHLKNKKETYNVPEGFAKIWQVHPVCIFGSDEDTDLRNKFNLQDVKIITVPGNHHYNKNPEAVVRAIYEDVLNNLGKLTNFGIKRN